MRSSPQLVNQQIDDVIREKVITLSTQSLLYFQNNDVDNTLASIILAMSYYLIDPFILTADEQTLSTTLQQYFLSTIATKRLQGQSITISENLVNGASDILNYIPDFNLLGNEESQLKAVDFDRTMLLEILSVWNAIGKLAILHQKSQRS